MQVTTSQLDYEKVTIFDDALGGLVKGLYSINWVGLEVKNRLLGE